MHSFLNTVFTKAFDRKGIDEVMKNKATKCVLIEYKHPDAANSNILDCAVFQNFHLPPFGAFVSYEAINDKFKLTTCTYSLVWIKVEKE